MKGDIDRAPSKGDIDIDVEVDVDMDRYLGCSEAVSKSVQVLFNDFEIPYTIYYILYTIHYPRDTI